MSREYYARIECSRLNKYHGGFDLNPIDKIWQVMISNCGYEQILKIEEYYVDEEIVDYTIHFIMGCSGGVSPQTILDDIIRDLDKEKGVGVYEAYVWSLHPDDVKAEHRNKLTDSSKGVDR